MLYTHRQRERTRQYQQSTSLNLCKNQVLYNRRLDLESKLFTKYAQVKSNYVTTSDLCYFLVPDAKLLSLSYLMGVGLFRRCPGSTSTKLIRSCFYKTLTIHKVRPKITGKTPKSKSLKFLRLRS